MKRLSGADAFFLYSERPTWPMHTGALVVLDPSGVPDFGIEKVRRRIEQGLHKLPEFTMTVKEVPFGLDLPMLVDDPDFDIECHLHRVGVPAPGGRRELGELVGTLVEVPLDRRRPLWEVWLIEGLEGGQVALFTKVHHSIVDGVSGAGLAEILCDLEPNPPAPEPNESADIDAARDSERLPGDLELAARGLVSAFTSPVRLGRWAGGATRRLVQTVRVARPRGGRTFLDQAPAVPWVGTLSPLRNFAFESVALDDIKEVRKAFDVKVNDVVLALASGAIRRWLIEQDALPESPIIASVPMSIRSDGDVELGNKLTTLFTSLETHVDDPVERLRAIAEKMQAAKEIGNALKAKEIRRLSESVVPGLANLGWRAYQAANLEAHVPNPSNLIVSNVPGPPIPLYTCGARIVGMHPVPPVVLSQGLNVTVMSYLDSVDFGFTVDRRMIADPWQMATGVHRALDELKTAAKGVATTAS